jgi:ribonuclease HI
LQEAKRYIGLESNNVAEYRAVLLGLCLARKLGAGEVCLINDSELVARQLRGEYKVKNAGLQPLFIQARQELSDFVRWSIENVPRDQNTRADELVNEALDEAASLP